MNNCKFIHYSFVILAFAFFIMIACNNEKEEKLYYTALEAIYNCNYEKLGKTLSNPDFRYNAVGLSEGEPLLYHAIMLNDPISMIFLLKDGAPLQRPDGNYLFFVLLDRDSRPPADAQRIKMVEILLQYNVDPDEIHPKLGFNTFHILAASSQFDNAETKKSIVKMFIEHGAKGVNAKDIAGMTPMDYAKKRNLPGSIEALKYAETLLREQSLNNKSGDEISVESGEKSGEKNGVKHGDESSVNLGGLNFPIPENSEYIQKTNKMIIKCKLNEYYIPIVIFKGPKAFEKAAKWERTWPAGGPDLFPNDENWSSKYRTEEVQILGHNTKVHILNIYYGPPPEVFSELIASYVFLKEREILINMRGTFVESFDYFKSWLLEISEE